MFYIVGEKEKTGSRIDPDARVIKKLCVFNCYS